MEKICNRFTFLTLENYINQPAVVFGVSDCGLNALILKIKVTETDLQTDEGKPLPILETLPILKTPNPQDFRRSRILRSTIHMRSPSSMRDGFPT